MSLRSRNELVFPHVIARPARPTIKHRLGLRVRYRFRTLVIMRARSATLIFNLLDLTQRGAPLAVMALAIAVSSTG